jgi:hypothetical protein
MKSAVTEFLSDLPLIICYMIYQHIDCHYDTIYDRESTTSHSHAVSGTLDVFEVMDEHSAARDAEAGTQHAEHHVLKQHSASELEADKYGTEHHVMKHHSVSE